MYTLLVLSTFEIFSSVGCNFLCLMLYSKQYTHMYHIYYILYLIIVSTVNDIDHRA